MRIHAGGILHTNAGLLHNGQRSRMCLVSPYRAKLSGPRLVEFKCGVCKGQKATEYDEVSYDEHAGASELYVVGTERHARLTCSGRYKVRCERKAPLQNKSRRGDLFCTWQVQGKM